MLPVGQIPTWRDFTEAFREHPFPRALLQGTGEEFCSFTQGKTAVEAYGREFENLAHYATEEVSTDAKDDGRFRKGLNPKLRRDLHLHHCNTFQALVNKAINAETAQLTYEESRKHTRDLVSSSGSSSQKRRIWIPNSALPPGYTPRPSCVAPYPVQPHAPTRPIDRPLVNAGPRPTSGTCFTCGEPGHYARDCSQASYAPPQPEKPIGRDKPPCKMVNVKSAPTERGRVHHVSAKDAHDDPDVVLGTLLVNCHQLRFYLILEHLTPLFLKAM